MATNRQVNGRIQGLSLPTLLQALELEKQTCTLRVFSAAREGVIYFREGDLLAASAPGMQGLAAVMEMLRWSEVEIDIAHECPAMIRHIDTPVTRILLESSKLADEGARDSSRSAENAAPSPDGRAGRLQGVLSAFRENLSEFVATDVVDIESGLSIGGDSIDGEFDASVASASFAEVVKSNARALELLGLGSESAEDVLITTKSVYLLLRMLGRGYYLSLAVGRKGNLGLARALMKKYESGILEVLD